MYTVSVYVFGFCILFTCCIHSPTISPINVVIYVKAVSLVPMIEVWTPSEMVKSTLDLSGSLRRIA